jgi:hypothetical protein
MRPSGPWQSYGSLLGGHGKTESTGRFEEGRHVTPRATQILVQIYLRLFSVSTTQIGTITLPPTTHQRDCPVLNCSLKLDITGR